MNKINFLLLPLFLLLSPLQSPNFVQANTELRALMDLKSSLDPENKVLLSWTSDGDPCSGSFLGVICNNHLKIANISLAGRGLNGKVSPSVSELKCLSGLYLHYNSIYGEIPREISSLTELVDLYLNVNNFSGSIPPEIGNMSSLQVVQLGYNQLVGNIPKEIGLMKQLNVLALQHNKLTGKIPLNLVNLENLKRLDLSINNLDGIIPPTLAGIATLEVLDVQNNSLSGIVPSGLRRLGKGFQCANNLNLCGVGFSTLKACNNYADINPSQISTSNESINNFPPKSYNDSAYTNLHCDHTHCSKSRRFPQAIIAATVITATITLISAGFAAYIRYRREKQRIRHTSEFSEAQLSPDQPTEFYIRSPSPLVNLNYYYNGFDSLDDGKNGSGLSHEDLNNFRFNVDEIESATQYLSEANLLGKKKFSAVYKGVLRDGSHVAIRSISVTCCKPEEGEFVKGLKLLTSLRHENIVKMRGFCCSSSRGECFLVYEFANKGDLSKYLDLEDGNSSDLLLDWSKRVSIIKGIAKGIGYLHSNEQNKPTIVHQNISVEKVVLDNQFNPLIMDAGLSKILADDVVFSALKVSAAMGYLAPEYITIGRFTEKSDVYAFGVIVLQVLSGKTTIGGSMRVAVESFRFEDFVDTNLNGRYSKTEAAILSKLALLCTHEVPDQRPNMVEVIQEMSVFSGHSS